MDNKHTPAHSSYAESTTSQWRLSSVTLRCVVISSVSWILVSFLSLWALSSLGPEMQRNAFNLSIVAGFVAGASAGLLYVGAILAFGRGQCMAACLGLSILLVPALLGFGTLVLVDVQQRASLSQFVLQTLGLIPFLALASITVWRTYPRWSEPLAERFSTRIGRLQAPLATRKRRERRVQAASIATALALTALLAGSADAQMVKADQQPSLILASEQAGNGELAPEKLQRYLDWESRESTWLAESNRYQSMLDRDEIRRLDRVRFELHRFQAHPGMMEMQANSTQHQRVRGMMRDVARHMAQDYLEQRLELEDVEIRWKNKMQSYFRRGEQPEAAVGSVRQESLAGQDDDRHFSLSPQARISDDPSLGLKMRLKGGEGFLSRFSVRLDQWLTNDRQRLRFHYYQGGGFDGALELSAGDEDDDRGERISLWMRARF